MGMMLLPRSEKFLKKALSKNHSTVAPRLKNCEIIKYQTLVTETVLPGGIRLSQVEIDAAIRSVELEALRAEKEASLKAASAATARIKELEKKERELLK